MSRLLIVRHGEAEGNIQRLLLGWLDSPLSELGREEAAAVGRRLASSPVSRVISSDLSRAADTAAAIAASHGLEVELDQRLREIFNGEWEGHTPESVAAGWPDLWRRVTEGEDLPRPGGESWSDVRARALRVIEELRDLTDDEDVVLVTHGGTALTVLGWAAGIPPGRDPFRGPFAPLHNASVSALAMPHASITAVNDTGHLGSPRLPGAPSWIRRETS